MNSPLQNLKFRCTGCGNCCKEPILPLTDLDVQRLAETTGEGPEAFVRFKDKWSIDLDDEPEAFAILRQGKRVMVMRQRPGRCYFLGDDDRCTIYEHRPLGCRLFPFDPVLGKDRKIRKLPIVNVIDCPYELDGNNDADALALLKETYDREYSEYYDRVDAWNQLQRRRKRQGKPAESSAQFLEFLGLLPTKKSARSKLTSKAEHEGS